MELNYLIRLIDELPQNSKLSYVRGEDVCTYVKVDKVENRLYAITPKGKECTFAESFLLALASGIIPNVAFNTSQLLNNKGSNRAVVDSIIANTAEFYWFAKDGAKFTVWIPTERHPAGELAEWTDMDSIKCQRKFCQDFCRLLVIRLLRMSFVIVLSAFGQSLTNMGLIIKHMCLNLKRSSILIFMIIRMLKMYSC